MKEKVDLYLTNKELRKIQIVILIITCIVGDLIYNSIWNKSILIFIINFYRRNALLFILCIFLSIIIHELIHYISFILIGKVTFKDVTMGFDKKHFCFYTDCFEYIRAIEYIWVLACPMIILGLIPYIVGLLSSNIYISSIGLFMTLGSSGDLMLIYLIRKLSFNTKIKTHDKYFGFSIKS